MRPAIIGSAGPVPDIAGDASGESYPSKNCEIYFPPGGHLNDRSQPTCLEVLAKAALFKLLLQINVLVITVVEGCSKAIRPTQENAIIASAKPIDFGTNSAP